MQQTVFIPTPMEPSTSATGANDTSGKPDHLKRFLAVLIDSIIATVIYLVLAFINNRLGYLGAAAYMLLRDGFEFDFMDQRSIGKKLMKLRPVSLKGEPMDLRLSVMRNWPLALGWLGSAIFWGLSGILGLMGLVEAILVLTDSEARRIGDKVADTKVIEVSD